MASLNAAQIQTKIDNLNETYDTLTTKLATQRAGADRSVTYQELKDIRGEIEAWEKRLNISTQAASTFTIGRPTR